MPVYVNVSSMYGKPHTVKYGKEGRYGIVVQQKWIVDVAGTMDEARKKAVKWFKSAVKNIRWTKPDPIYIIGSGYTEYGHVTLAKIDFQFKNGDVNWEYFWKSGWVYVFKNVKHPFDPKTGKLLKK